MSFSREEIEKIMQERKPLLRKPISLPQTEVTCGHPHCEAVERISEAIRKANEELKPDREDLVIALMDTICFVLLGDNMQQYDGMVVAQKIEDQLADLVELGYQRLVHTVQGHADSRSVIRVDKEGNAETISYENLNKTRQFDA